MVFCGHAAVEPVVFVHTGSLCPLLYLSLADFPVACQIMAVTLMVMGNSKNLRVFNFAIQLKSQKSRKFDAREVYVFYSSITYECMCLCCSCVVVQKLTINTDDSEIVVSVKRQCKKTEYLNIDKQNKSTWH